MAMESVGLIGLFLCWRQRTDTLDTDMGCSLA